MIQRSRPGCIQGKKLLCKILGFQVADPRGFLEGQKITAQKLQDFWLFWVGRFNLSGVFLRWKKGGGEGGSLQAEKKVASYS